MRWFTLKIMPRTDSLSTWSTVRPILPRPSALRVLPLIGGTANGALHLGEAQGLLRIRHYFCSFQPNISPTDMSRRAATSEGLCMALRPSAAALTMFMALLVPRDFVMTF